MPVTRGRLFAVLSVSGICIAALGTPAAAQAPSARHCATERALGRYPTGCPQRVTPRPRPVPAAPRPQQATPRPAQPPRTRQASSSQREFSLPPGAGAIGVGAPPNCLVSTTSFIGIPLEDIYCRTPRGRWYRNSWPSIGRFSRDDNAMQLGAFSSADAALEAWLAINRRFDLDRFLPFIAEVRVANRAIYRLRASTAMGGQLDSAATCRRITSAGETCVIVTPPQGSVAAGNSDERNGHECRNVRRVSYVNGEEVASDVQMCRRIGTSEWRAVE